MRSLHCGKAGDHQRHPFKTQQGWWHCSGLEDERPRPNPLKKVTDVRS